jgi:hypothetical protein
MFFGLSCCLTPEQLATLQSLNTDNDLSLLIYQDQGNIAKLKQFAWDEALKLCLSNMAVRQYRQHAWRHRNSTLAVFAYAVIGNRQNEKDRERSGKGKGN